MASHSSQSLGAWLRNGPSRFFWAVQRSNQDLHNASANPRNRSLSLSAGRYVRPVLQPRFFLVISGSGLREITKKFHRVSDGDSLFLAGQRLEAGLTASSNEVANRVFWDIIRHQLAFELEHLDLACGWRTIVDRTKIMSFADRRA